MRCSGGFGDKDNSEYGNELLLLNTYFDELENPRLSSVRTSIVVVSFSGCWSCAEKLVLVDGCDGKTAAVTVPLDFFKVSDADP
jgi:phage replication-related protein YjqB (UPF0714/DUF867 family)